ncbi:hypothetical Protein YC6258_02997 [Gynuella sunshinyii YC6258]|uniref:Uncharacterized protein n=1 Tax=Gynuella sunshinyii YC6258 TaxID=1445510 RepID=A0A0C5V6F0_9GAMM|nr:hypothetical Protein YC6258_02997 [Gynuella sunshinyii YC6258]
MLEKLVFSFHMYLLSHEKRSHCSTRGRGVDRIFDAGQWPKKNTVMTNFQVLIIFQETDPGSNKV